MSKRGGEPIICFISVKDECDKKEVQAIVDKLKKADRKVKVIEVIKEDGTASLEVPKSLDIHKFKKELGFKLVVV